MKICPKCSFPSTSHTECDKCGVQFGDIRGKNGMPTASLDCPWNDHGAICGVRGSLSDGTHGEGPWYCSPHFWKLKGYEVNEVPHAPYAERIAARKTQTVPDTPIQREPGEDEAYMIATQI